MNIDTSGVEAVFRFSAKEYIMVLSNGQWSLNPRIDRSYKGKDEDIGSPIVFLTDQEAQALKSSGYLYTELFIDSPEALKAE
jgi:hypothetical protein